MALLSGPAVIAHVELMSKSHCPVASNIIHVVPAAMGTLVHFPICNKT